MFQNWVNNLEILHSILIGYFYSVKYLHYTTPRSFSAAVVSLETTWCVSFSALGENSRSVTAVW